MRIIFIGDIVGKSGREAIEKKLPIIRLNLLKSHLWFLMLDDPFYFLNNF